MRILLILSIIIFCLIIGGLNKKKVKFSFVLSLAFVFSPVVFFPQINNKIFISFCLSFLMIIFLEVFKNKIIKNILLFLIIIFYGYVILNLIEIINIKANIDIQKLFFIDNLSLDTIKRFQENALYLPIFLRPIVYNPFQLLIVLFKRIINFLWFDKLIEFLGFSVLYLIYLSFKIRKNTKYLLILVLIVTFFVLHRDPNTYLNYLFLIPPLILFIFKNTNKINFKFLLIFIILNFVYFLL